MGFFDRPQLPGAQPMPEPPGNDIARQMLLRSMMQHSINPYGMSPEGASGIDGPLFSTGLQPSPVFGQTSRGDVGDPFFRQSFLGGPQYAKGQSIWDRMGFKSPDQQADSVSGSASMGGGMGGALLPASAGSRVALSSGMSPSGSGGSVSSLLQMLMQIMQGQQGGGSSPRSFFDGRKVGTRRRFSSGPRSFYDALDRSRDNTDEPKSAPEPGESLERTLAPMGTGNPLSGALGTMGPRRGRPIPPQSGSLGSSTGTLAPRGSGGSIETDLGDSGPTRPDTQVVPPRGNGGGGGGSRQPYNRSEHVVNWGPMQRTDRAHGFWQAATPYAGQWQMDANGMPIGPGGFRYTGAQHEFSGGLGQSGVNQVNSANGGPTYAQWLDKVREIQGQQALANTAASQDRMAKLGSPESRATGNARDWIVNHGLMGHPTAVVDPGPTPVNNTGTNPNSPV